MTRDPLSNWGDPVPRLEPLPGQLELFPDRPEHSPPRTKPPVRDGQSLLFDSGADLPGAGEREQKIIWDL